MKDGYFGFVVIVTAALALVLAVSGTLGIQAEKERRLRLEQEQATEGLASEIAAGRAAVLAEITRLREAAPLVLGEDLTPAERVEVALLLGWASGEAVKVELARATAEEAALGARVDTLEATSVDLLFLVVELRLALVERTLRDAEFWLEAFADDTWNYWEMAGVPAPAAGVPWPK